MTLTPLWLQVDNSLDIIFREYVVVTFSGSDLLRGDKALIGLDAGPGLERGPVPV